MSDISRRQFIAATGLGAASIWLVAEARDVIAAGVHAAQAKKFDVLSDADAADIEAAMAQIIPSDGTPGAREARSVYFLDHALGSFAKEQREVFEKGAKDLRSRAAKAQPGAKSFAALSEANQIAVLTALEKDKKNPFFGALRFATIAGMFANPEYGGNYNKAGWRMLGFNDQFSWAAPFGWYDHA